MKKVKPCQDLTHKTYINAVLSHLGGTTLHVEISSAVQGLQTSLTLFHLNKNTSINVLVPMNPVYRKFSN